MAVRLSEGVCFAVTFDGGILFNERCERYGKLNHVEAFIVQWILKGSGAAQIVEAHERHFLIGVELSCGDIEALCRNLQTAGLVTGTPRCCGSNARRLWRIDAKRAGLQRTWGKRLQDLRGRAGGSSP